MPAAVADGIDGRVRSLAELVDQNAVIEIEARLLRQFDLRHGADPGKDNVGLKVLPIGESHAAKLVAIIIQLEALDPRAGEHLYAAGAMQRFVEGRYFRSGDAGKQAMLSLDDGDRKPKGNGR